MDGTEDRGEEITFRTTAAIPLTGGTFDNWNQSGKVWNPWGSNETPFWDTGNQGATTLGDSNSVPTEDIWSGKTTGMAAKLESKFVGVGSAGKLAAGNLFVGKYVATDGTNGILNFGQSFSAYPPKHGTHIPCPLSNAEHKHRNLLHSVQRYPDLPLSILLMKLHVFQSRSLHPPVLLHKAMLH